MKTEKMKGSDGVSTILKTLEDDGSGWEHYAIEGFKFDADIFSLESAKSWLVEHDIKATIKSIIAESD